MTVEYLERLGVEYKCELWLVRQQGAIGIAHVYEADDRRWVGAIHESTALWAGFTAPHLVPVHASTLDRDRFVVVTGDDRGPSLLEAARLLPDAAERERWAAAEIAGIAEAISAMATMLTGREPRGAPLVHRRAGSDNMVVGSDGCARLRPSIAWVKHPMGTGWVGQGNAMHGSFSWLSPEQIRDRDITPASDVYQLAATLYSALTLKRPFPADNDFAQLQAILGAPRPTRIDCTPALAALVSRNMAVDPAERDRDPATFAANLRRMYPAPEPALRARVAASRPDRRPAPGPSSLIVGSRCTKEWEQLAPTSQDGIRYCRACKHDVVQVRSIEALVPLLGKRCVSYTPDGN